MESGNERRVVRACRLVWQKSLHCFVVRMTGQCWSHATTGSDAGDASVSTRSCLQKSFSFYPRGRSPFLTEVNLHAIRRVTNANFPNLRRSVLAPKPGGHLKPIRGSGSACVSATLAKCLNFFATCAPNRT